MTPEEYLAFERASPERHELHDGELFPIVGGTREHSQICMNLGALLTSISVEVSLADIYVNVFGPQGTQ